MNLFDLAAVLTLDKSGYEKGLGDAEQEASGFGDKLKKGLGTAANVAKTVTSAALTAGSSIMKLASDSASTMDTIDKASQKMGISAEGYQEWSHAMDLSGMSIDTMKNGMKTLQTAMAKNDDTFASLGISLTDAEGNMRSAEDVMNDAILALSDMEEGAERTALANKLFGRAGVEMAPLLNQGSAAIKNMKQEAHDLGLVMSGDDVKAGAELNDTLNNLKQSFQAIITKLGSSLMPIVKKVADMLLKFLPKISEMFDRFAPMLLDLADQILPFLMELAEALLPVIFDILETLMPVLMDIVRAILPVIQTALTAINPLLQLLASLLKPVLDIVNLLLKPLLDLVNWVFGGVIDGFNGVADSLGDNGFIGLLGGLAETIGDVFGWIGTLFDDPAEALKQAFEGVYDFAVNVFRSIGTIASGIFELIDNAQKRDKHAAETYARAAAQVAEAEKKGWIFEEYEDELGYKRFKQVGYQKGSEAERILNEVNGTIKVEGVNNEDELVAVADYTMDELSKDLRRANG